MGRNKGYLEFDKPQALKNMDAESSFWVVWFGFGKSFLRKPVTI